MTAGKFSGDLLILDIDGTPLAHSTDSTLTVTQDAPETTTKQSGGWKEVLIDGHRTFEMSASGLVTYDATTNAPHDLLGGILNNSTNALIWTTGDVGDEAFTGTGKLTSLSENSPQNAPVSFEVTFTGTGPLVQSTNV